MTTQRVAGVLAVLVVAAAAVLGWLVLGAGGTAGLATTSAESVELDGGLGRHQGDGARGGVRRDHPGLQLLVEDPRRGPCRGPGADDPRDAATLRPHDGGRRHVEPDRPHRRLGRGGRVGAGDGHVVVRPGAALREPDAPRATGSRTRCSTSTGCWSPSCATVASGGSTSWMPSVQPCEHPPDGRIAAWTT